MVDAKDAGFRKMRVQCAVERACGSEVAPEGLLDHHACSLRAARAAQVLDDQDRKSTRLNSSHSQISYAVFCLKKKKKNNKTLQHRTKYILNIYSSRVGIMTCDHNYSY